MSLPFKQPVASGASKSNRLEPAALLASLEALLTEMLSAHKQALANTRDHREAVAQADRVRMARCASKQAEINVRTESLNRERASLLVAFRQGVSLREVLSSMAGHDTERCAQLGDELKQTVVTLRKEQARLALASSSLAQHMQGLIQQIHRSLSHAGVYSTQGRVEAGAVVVSGFDVTS